MATIDSLDIKISASAQKASDAIDGLVKKLGNLQKALEIDTSGLEKLGNINGANFQKLGMGLNSYATAVRKVQDVNPKTFTNLAKGIGKLAAIQPGNMQAVAASIEPLARGVQVLSGANFDNKNLQNLINSLARLGSANMEGLSNVDFVKLGNSIRDFSNAMAGVDKVPQSVISLTNSIARLAKAGGNIGAVTEKLPALGAALETLVRAMSKTPGVAPGIVSFVQAIASLANAGNKAGVTAGNLKKLGDELIKFFQTMSRAPNVSQSTIQMTQALSQLSNVGGRAGTAANALQRGMSGFSGSSQVAHRAVNKFDLGVKNLSLSMSKLKNPLKKTTSMLRNFATQTLASLGVYAGIYGAIRGLKGAVEGAMDYVETLNYFNAAFRQVAENADLSGWAEAGSKSAEAYANSFRDRAKQLTQKLTGFEVSDTGELTRASTPSLGLDPDKTMQYQATFAQMTSSMGATSDAAVKVSNALTMIGADLASVRNLDFDKVWNDMASGLAGMSRTLDKYGVNIRNVNLQQKLNSLGIDESITKINQQDKALLRTIILLESTRYAWGDLASTINDSEKLSLVA